MICLVRAVSIQVKSKNVNKENQNKSKSAHNNSTFVVKKNKQTKFNALRFVQLCTVCIKQVISWYAIPS